METTDISYHQWRIYECLKTSSETWRTSAEIAGDSGVNARTTRAHLLRFVDSGIVEQASTFPGYRYRLSAAGIRKNRAMVDRLERSGEIFKTVKSEDVLGRSKHQ